MLGNHVIKNWSTNQAVLALSSGEAEFYSLVKAGSVVLGIQALAADLGVVYRKAPVIKTDASAAIGISNRLGIGKIRHIEVNQLWLQDKVAKGVLVIEKVPTDENLADALTKGVDAATIHKHLGGVGVEIRTDRHHLAPQLEDASE